MGGTRPSPAFPPLWAPPRQAVSTPPGLPRPGTELGVHRRPCRLKPRLPRLCPPAQRRAAPPAPPARPSPPPGPGPACSGLRAPPLGLTTTLGQGRGRRGSRPRGRRPRAYLSARGSSSGCCLGSKTALAARTLGGAGSRLRVRRVRSRGPIAPRPAARSLLPLVPTLSRGLDAPPLPARPPRSAHPADRSGEGARQGRRESRGIRRQWGLLVRRLRGDAICRSYYYLSDANISLRFVTTVILLRLSFYSRCYCYLHGFFSPPGGDGMVPGRPEMADTQPLLPTDAPGRSDTPCGPHLCHVSL